ncbi:MAG: DUF2950 domain-containing protein [Hyphomicrobiaceae bacterium]
MTRLKQLPDLPKEFSAANGMEIAMKRLSILLIVFIGYGLCILPTNHTMAQEPVQKTYGSPDEAATALMKSLAAGNPAEMLAILGPDARELTDSGDPVSDERDRKRFVAAYKAKHAIQSEGPDKAILEVGEDAFPFPIPIVRLRERWAFDAAEGKEEVLNRRIGRNELNTIQTLLAIADAQFEYANRAPPGTGVREYAQKFTSSEVTKDGLYWPAKDGEEQSPLGSLVANAVRAGYEPKQRETGESSQPYHGYHFKMLLAQGRNAPGGTQPYIVQGRMIGGFAVIAYPADYGNSGVKTFIISHDRIVFEIDLGEDTKQISEAVRTFDPTSSWKEVKTGN